MNAYACIYVEGGSREGGGVPARWEVGHGVAHAVYEFAKIYIHYIYIFIFTYIYTYIYIYVCVCV